MTSATIRRSALVGIAVLLLMGSNFAFADSGHTSSSQQLSFAVGTTTNPGTIVNLGDQRYSVSGGQVQPYTEILGQPLASGVLQFSLQAHVSGLRASGNVQFTLKGTSVTGQRITATGEYDIDNSMTSTPSNADIYPGPSGSCTGRAAASCSELPFSFIGATTVHVTIGDAKPQDVQAVMTTENPYLNPFGNPILIASADNPPSILIVTTYTRGTIQWTGSQVTGPINGVLTAGSSTTPVTGVLGMNITESEDLVAGTTRDSGTIALTSMSPSTLDVSGTFRGASTIPTLGEYSCASTFNLLPGTCMFTGLDSSGTYTMTNSNGNGNGNDHGSGFSTNDGNGGNGNGSGSSRITVAGAYQTIWSVPAFYFGSGSQATVTQG